MHTMLVQEHKDKNNPPKVTQGFNMVQPTMPTSMDKRESFHYTI